MNFFEAQEFFKKMYPDKLVSFEFDDNCIRQIECIYTEGQLHPINHVEYNRVKVTPQYQPSIYVPIQSHRSNISVSVVKSKIAKDDVYMHPDMIQSFKQLKDTPSYEIKMKEHMDITGLSKATIESKIV